MSFISKLFGSKKKKEQIDPDRFRKWENRVDQLCNSMDMLTDRVKWLVDRERNRKIEPPKEISHYPLLPEECFPIKEYPIKKAILTNDQLMVILQDNQTIQCSGANKDLYNKVLQATSTEEVMSIMIPDYLENKKKGEEKKREEEQERKGKIEQEQKVLETVSILVEGGDFIEKDRALYLEGIDLSIPKRLLNEFERLVSNIVNYDDIISPEVVKAAEMRYEALKNFWRWCAANPNPQAREDLFKFLENHDLGVNKHGFFFNFRRVNKVGKTNVDYTLTEFVSSNFLIIKTKWKKNPKNFWVGKRGEDLKIFKLGQKADDSKGVWTNQGNLAELNESLKNNDEVYYTDARTGTFKIKIGEPVRMDRRKCDSDPSRDCSSGLHSGNKAFGFSGNGDTMILCLINPMNVVSVPNYDCNKMRSCEYLPVGVINDPDDVRFLEDADTVELADWYFEDQVGKLDDLLQNTPQMELQKHGYVPTQIPNMDNIVETFMEQIVDRKNAILGRVKVVN